MVSPNEEPKKDDKQTTEELRKEIAELRQKEREREKERVEAASIDEMIDEKLSNMKGKGAGGLSIMGILINAAVAAVVVLIMSTMGLVGVSTNQFNKSMDAIATDMSTKIGSSTLQSYPTRDELVGTLSGLETGNPYITQDILDAALEGVTAPDLSGYVLAEDYDAMVAGFEDRIAELEEGQASGAEDAEEPVDAITVDLGYSGYLTYPALDGTLNQAIFFDVENNLDTDVTEVELQLTLHSRGIAIPFDIGLCAVTEGYPLDWQIVYVGSGMVVLQGVTPPWGDGLEIDAEDTESVYLTLNLGDTSATQPENNTRLYIEVECTDYTIPE